MQERESSYTRRRRSLKQSSVDQLKSRDEARRHWRTLAISIVGTMIAISASAVSVYWTRASIRQANRAWIGLAKPPTLIRREGTTYTYSYYLKNFGRGPALKLMATDMLLQGRDGAHQVGTKQHSMCKDVVAFSAYKRRSILEPYSAGIYGDTLFPDQIINYPRVTKQMRYTINPSLGNPVFVYIVGCVSYIDQFLQPHWMRFCYNGFVENNDKVDWWETCDLDNDMDETRELND